MRNSSDIFCLNENRTDGMQVFSVNGACPLKINRRKPRQNESFQYGCDNVEGHFDRGDRAPDATSFAPQSADDVDEIANVAEHFEEGKDAAGDIQAPLGSVKEENVFESADIDEAMISSERQCQLESGAVKKDQSTPGRKSEKQPLFRKLKTKTNSDSKNVAVSTSNISRNPLTGAGMETTEYRKPKKGPKNRSGKWLW